MRPGKNAQTIRKENLLLILENILCADGIVSRAQLAQKTGLTRATVSRLVDELIDLDILDELDPVRSTIGRPSAPLVAKSGTFCVVGIEVALQYISVVVTDLSGAELYKVLQPINARLSDPKVILRSCAEMLDGWKTPVEVRIVSVVIAIPGLVSNAKHRIVTAPNLGWSDIKITDSFVSHKHPKTPITVVNEADASAYSMLYKNPGQIGGTSDFLYLSAGVGVGAALIYEGRLFSGQHGWAGEIGHMCVDTGGPKCSCGSNGCLEQYAGLDAMLTRANLPVGESVAPLIDHMEKGNLQARETVDLCAKSLGTTIANVLNLLDLDTVVMGGHFAQLFNYMEVILMSELKYRLLSSRWSSINVKPGQHGTFTAAHGACLLGFERFLRKPGLWAKP